MSFVVYLLTRLSIIFWTVSLAVGSSSLNKNEIEIEEIGEWKSEFFMYVMETTPSICSEAEASSANVTGKLREVRNLMELSPEEILRKYGSLQNVRAASAPLFSELSGGVSLMCSLRDEQVCVEDTCVKCDSLRLKDGNGNNFRVICEEASKLVAIYNEGLMEMARESKKTAKRILNMKLKGKGESCEENSLTNQMELASQVKFFLSKSEEAIVKERVEVGGDFQTSSNWKNRLVEMEQDAKESCSMISERLVCLEGRCKDCEDTSEEMKEILEELGYCKTIMDVGVGRVTARASVTSMGISRRGLVVWNVIQLVIVSNLIGLNN